MRLRTYERIDGRARKLFCVHEAVRDSIEVDGVLVSIGGAVVRIEETKGGTLSVQVNAAVVKESG